MGQTKHTLCIYTFKLKNVSGLTPFADIFIKLLISNPINISHFIYE